MKLSSLDEAFVLVQESMALGRCWQRGIFTSLEVVLLRLFDASVPLFTV